MKLRGTRLTAVAAAVQAAFNPASIFAVATGVWYSPSTPNTLSKKRYVWDPATAEGDDVALILDKSLGLASGAEQKASVTVGQAGTSLAGTYNTSTGAGTIAAASAGNESFVQLTGLTSAFTYVIDIENTNASSGFSIRQINNAGTVLHTLSPSTRQQIYFTGSTVFVLTANSTANAARSFTIHSIKHLAGYHARSPDDGAGRGVLALRNGHKVVTVDGVGDWFLSPTINALGSLSLSMYLGLVKQNNSTTQVPFDHNNGAQNSCAIRTMNVSRVIGYVRGTLNSGGVSSLYTYDVGAVAVAGLRYTSGGFPTLQCDLDALQTGGDHGTYAGPSSTMGYGASRSGNLFFTGELSEAIYYNKVVSGAEHANLMAWVNARIGAY